jgi:SAM-dependent methyltransferase
MSPVPTSENRTDCRSRDEILSVQDEEYSFPYHYVPSFGDSFTQTFTWTWGIRYAGAMEYLLEKLDELEFDSLADVGTGDGRLVRELTLRYPDRKVIGIDYSARAIGLARAMASDCAFLQRDIVKEPMEETWDLVTLIEVFEHIPPEFSGEFIRSLWRMIRPGGRLLMTVPHVNAPLPPKHFRHFTMESVLESFQSYFELEDSGFLERTDVGAERLLNRMLCNRFFILNWQPALNRIYRYYRQKILIAPDESVCSRICARFVRKEVQEPALNG